MIRSHLSGQGLVEYALILSLVGIVVLVVLSLFGPSIGNIFSNVFTTLSGAPPQVTEPLTPVGAWIYCSEEYNYCTFTGTKTIRYGKNGFYVTRVYTDGVHCGNAFFPDPIVGTVKDCYYWDPNASP